MLLNLLELTDTDSDELVLFAYFIYVVHLLRLLPLTSFVYRVFMYIAKCH